MLQDLAEQEQALAAEPGETGEFLTVTVPEGLGGGLGRRPEHARSAALTFFRRSLRAA